MIETALARIDALITLGGPVVAVLLAFSVAALAVMLWKLAVFSLEGVSGGVSRGFARAALDGAREARHRGRPAEALRARTLARLEVGYARAGAGLRLLDVIAQIAPLLGLFGTVLGMIDAFRTLQEAGSSADPSLLAGGIWVALVTTAAGLVVAMPSALALNWFDARLEAHRIAAEEALEDILAPDVFAAPALQGGLAHA